MKVLTFLFSLLFFANLIKDGMTAKKKPTHKLVRDSLNHMFGAQDSLMYRCDLQCYCDKCSSENPAFKHKCEELLPKRRIPNCQCEENMKCPTPEELDETCMMYCFCKNCRDDPRMIPEIAGHCDSNKDLIQSCDCDKFGDCSVLDLLPTKDARAGKLKDAVYHPEL